MISVIVPAYNEAATVGRVIGHIWHVLRETQVPFEILAVDDGSSDGTYQVLSELVKVLPSVRVLRLTRNTGKSCAVMAGLSAADGTMIAIQDADDEYDPTPFLTAVVREYLGQRRAVIASRMLGQSSWGSAWQRNGNLAFTGLLNRATGLSLTDALSGQKAWPREATDERALRSSGWGLDVRVSLMLLDRRYPITEVPAIYCARQKAQGKKFGVRAYPSLLWPLVSWSLGLRPSRHALHRRVSSAGDSSAVSLGDTSARANVPG